MMKLAVVRRRLTGLCCFFFVAFFFVGGLLLFLLLVFIVVVYTLLALGLIPMTLCLASILSCDMYASIASHRHKMSHIEQDAQVQVHLASLLKVANDG